MANRKKRLNKGIESIQKQIKLHEEKKEIAHEKGKVELEGDYEKEIERFKKTEKVKRRLLER